MKRIAIKQYEQAADEKVSIGGIKWINKWDVCVQCDSLEEAEALKARLAEPEKEQEPVAWMYPDDCERMQTSETFCTVFSVPVGHPTQGKSTVALYTAPPQREWQGLTDEDRSQIAKKAYNKAELTAWELAQRVGEFTEAKLKEKNTWKLQK